MSEKHEMKLIEVLRRTRNRHDPLATKDQQKWIYFVWNYGELLYLGISASPMIRLRQHYTRPYESELGKAMRSWGAGFCLDWQCEFVSASGGFAEEHALIEKHRPQLNIYCKPNEEPPSDY